MVGVIAEYTVGDLGAAHASVGVIEVVVKVALEAGGSIRALIAPFVVIQAPFANLAVQEKAGQTLCALVEV